jgi:hypothetical protein
MPGRGQGPRSTIPSPDTIRALAFSPFISRRRRLYSRPMSGKAQILADINLHGGLLLLSRL